MALTAKALASGQRKVQEDRPDARSDPCRESGLQGGGRGELEDPQRRLQRRHPADRDCRAGRKHGSRAEPRRRHAAWPRRPHGAPGPARPSARKPTTSSDAGHPSLDAQQDGQAAAEEPRRGLPRHADQSAPAHAEHPHLRRQLRRQLRPPVPAKKFGHEQRDIIASRWVAAAAWWRPSSPTTWKWPSCSGAASAKPAT